MMDLTPDNPPTPHQAQMPPLTRHKPKPKEEPMSDAPDSNLSDWVERRVNQGWSHPYTAYIIREIRELEFDNNALRTERSRLHAEVERLRSALLVCCSEIDDYIRQEYPHDHPVQERCRRRDFAANPARLALATQQEEPTE